MLASVRHDLPLMVVLCLGILAGCATVVQHPLDAAGPEYAMAVVPARYAPATGFGDRPYDETLARGALGGAATGAVGSVLMLGLGAAVFPPLGIPLALGMAPVMIGGGAVAGLAGAAATGPWGGATVVTEEQRTVLARALEGALADPPLPKLAALVVAREIAFFAPFRAEVVESAGPASANDVPEYRALSDRGFNSALEIRFTNGGFSGWSADGITLYVTAEARLVDTATGKATWLRGLVYESSAHAASEWLDDGARLMRNTLERAYAVLAERIVDVLVLSTEPSTPVESSAAPATCGVALSDPAFESQPAAPGDQGRASSTSIAVVLSWQAVPLQWFTLSRNPWENAKDLRYDLRIWKAVGSAQETIVYERRGLSGTQHRVEVPLEPGTRFYWSVRLRATVDGHPRAAPWSALKDPPLIFDQRRLVTKAQFYTVARGDTLARGLCIDQVLWCTCADFIPARNFYRFETP